MLASRWVPESVDTTVPNHARAFDFLYGGQYNFPVDREVARRWLAAEPNLRRWAQESRAFLGRAVSSVADAGIRQIIDLGSGLPTTGATHEVVASLARDIRVCYVDYNPTVVAHAREILARTRNVHAVLGGIGNLSRLLRLAAAVGFESNLPVAVIVSGVSPLAVNAPKIVQALESVRRAVAPASRLVLSHGLPITLTSESAVETSTSPFYMPTEECDQSSLERLFGNWKLLDPGVHRIPLWQPTHQAAGLRHKCGETSQVAAWAGAAEGSATGAGTQAAAGIPTD
ncbi:SAM-dependent methyltransferase [Micromonospora sp. NPDC005324]|uniref:SAM-dependent methyltransferase n=1 Tax=Micromonospora sp. NPDC005324 TaxID=3157033 RepID=UPI0033AA8D3F